MLYIKFIDFDGKEYEFKNVVKLDITVKDVWIEDDVQKRSYKVYIGYYDDNGTYHQEIGDIPNIINVEFSL